jgi:hypothetical protein
MKTKIAFCLLFFYSIQLKSQLFINETMASNVTTVQDNLGIYSDWIEIYNAGATPVDLANYYMSDTKLLLTKFRFSATPGQVVVPANGYLIVWASGNILAGALHTNFSLSSTSGEAALLINPDGITVVDSISFLPQRDDVSFGRETNGSATLKYFSPSSPNAFNAVANSYSGFLTPPVFSHNGGFFNTNFQLTLSHPDPAVIIYYTTDGSNPLPVNNVPIFYNYKNSYAEAPANPAGSLLTRSYVSNIYSSSLAIQDRTSQPNQISNISSTWNFSPTYIPNYNLQKGTVIRAIATKPGILTSETKTNTYIFSATGLNNFTFPVMSVAMQENHLYDFNSGIYTAGQTFENYRAANPTETATVCTPGNFTNEGVAWEKPGNMELIETQTSVLNQSLQIRINGSCTTSQPYKSLRFYGVNNFNNFPFFPAYPSLLHKRIIMRNSGNDYNQTMFKDAFVSTWLGHLRFSNQKTRPAIMFLNGEYWGVYDIRERIDKYFLNALFGVNAENLDLRNIIWTGPAEIQEGDGIHFDNMNNFIIANNMADNNNYNTVKQMMDTDNFIDYQISEIYIGNIDWPQNNVRLWRNRTIYTPNAPYGHDGRWRWIMFDTDRSLGEVVNANNLDLAFHRDKPENIIFKKLLDNVEFKNAFVNRFADLYNSTFATTYAQGVYNNIKNQYAPEIQTHINRWKNISNLTAWNTECTKIVNYLGIRPNAMLAQYKSEFAIADDYQLTVATPDTIKGFVRVNFLDIKSSNKGLPANVQTWTGKYFDNIPLKIAAIAKTGYKFTHWIFNGTPILDSVIIVTTSTDRLYTAHFEIIYLSSNPIPTIAANIVSCGYKFTAWNNSEAPGSSPPNSKFVFLNTTDPLITSSLNSGNFVAGGAYNLATNTRINGLGANGVSFINTGGTLDPVGYPAGKLGGFLLAINTENLDSIKISWTGRTITANPRKHNIRLYYREGDIHPFSEFLPVVEYQGNTSTGHSQNFVNIKLPQSLMNKPYVQLFWKYYYTGLAATGARDQLALDDISIVGIKNFANTITTNLAVTNVPNQINNNGKIMAGSVINNFANNSIVFNHGFEANIGAVFKAEIKGCN